MHSEILINIMKSNLKNRLIKMQESGSTNQLIETISSQFKEIDEQLRENLLLDLIGSKNDFIVPIGEARIVQENFQDISKINRDKILDMFVDKCKIEFNDKSFIRLVFDILATNYYDISIDLQSFLLNYSKNYFGFESYLGDGRGDIFLLDSILAAVIAKNYNNLPKELQTMLIHNFHRKSNKLIRFVVTCSIIKYYNDLPKEIQNLLTNLPNDQDVLSEMAAKKISNIEGFDNIPINIRNEILKQI